MLNKTTLGFLFCSVAFSFGCSEIKPANITDQQAAKPMTESTEQLGQPASAALKIEIDPRTGEIVPSTSSVAAPEVAPVYEVNDSPVSGTILSSSAGFATPLTATVDCDENVSMGHGNQSLASVTDCQQEKGE